MCIQSKPRAALKYNEDMQGFLEKTGVHIHTKSEKMFPCRPLTKGHLAVLFPAKPHRFLEGGGTCFLTLLRLHDDSAQQLGGLPGFCPKWQHCLQFYS